MKNYKINIDKPKPTQEEILSGQNFDQLLKQYNAAPGKVIKKPFWQKGGFIGSVAAVAATIAIIMMVVKGNNNSITDEQQGPVIVDNGNIPVVDTAGQNNSGNNTAWAPTKKKVAPPLAGVNIPFREYKVSAKSGGTILYPSGTKVSFQPNSFVDANGKPVSGNVEVEYREMHDAVDFFLAGIPMEYDSAGATYILESAGMMEIAAFVNGKVVYLDKNKPMKVEMASAQTGTDYNLYQFDSVAGNWSYIGKDKVAEMPYPKDMRAQDSLEALQSWVAAQNTRNPFCGGTKKGKPVDATRPLKADPSKNRFVVDFNKKEFPEMASYENVIFEVDESKEKFDASNYNVTWESIILARGNEAKKYTLTLKKGLKTTVLAVYPVLDGAEYDAQIAKYDAAHAQYLKDSANYTEYVGMGGGSPNFNMNSLFEFDAAAAKDNALSYDMQRSFELSGFGIFNTDKPEALPKGSVLELALNTPDDQAFSGYTYSHVDRTRNSVMTYASGSKFYCNTRSQNLIWAVQNGELYYAEQPSFSNLPLVGKAVVTLKKVGKTLKNADEMRAFFGLKAPVESK